MIERKDLVKKCISRFIIYSSISIVSILALFHLAVLALPFLAFMWTQFFFDVFHMITLIDVDQRRKRQVGFLSFYYTYFFFSTVICLSLQKEGYTGKVSIYLIVNFISLVPALVFSFILIRKLLIEYLPEIRKKYFKDSIGK